MGNELKKNSQALTASSQQLMEQCFTDCQNRLGLVQSRLVEILLWGLEKLWIWLAGSKGLLAGWLIVF